MAWYDLNCVESAIITQPTNWGDGDRMQPTESPQRQLQTIQITCLFYLHVDPAQPAVTQDKTGQAKLKVIVSVAMTASTEILRKSAPVFW